MYSEKENANNVLTYILKICIFYIFYLTDYSIFCIDINTILFLNSCPTKQYNSMLCLCTVN